MKRQNLSQAFEWLITEQCAFGYFEKKILLS